MPIIPDANQRKKAPPSATRPQARRVAPASGASARQAGAAGGRAGSTPDPGHHRPERPGGTRHRIDAGRHDDERQRDVAGGRRDPRTVIAAPRAGSRGRKATGRADQAPCGRQERGLFGLLPHQIDVELARVAPRRDLQRGRAVRADPGRGHVERERRRGQRGFRGAARADEPPRSRAPRHAGLGAWRPGASRRERRGGAQHAHQEPDLQGPRLEPELDLVLAGGNPRRRETHGRRARASCRARPPARANRGTTCRSTRGMPPSQPRSSRARASARTRGCRPMRRSAALGELTERQRVHAERAQRGDRKQEIGHQPEIGPQRQPGERRRRADAGQRRSAPPRRRSRSPERSAPSGARRSGTSPT